MITSFDFCLSQLLKIEDLLLDEERVLPLRYHKRPTEYRDEDKIYTRLYKLDFIDFSVKIEPAANEVYVPHESLVNYHKYHALRNNTSDHILHKQTEEVSDFGLRELIDSMISEKIYNLFYDFAQILKRARKSHYFAGISDNATIIRNVLNLYQTVRKNKELQIAHLGSIRLHSSISNIITDIYITFLSDRLSMLELKEIKVDQTFISSNDGPQLKWNGTQQHLVELYLRLMQTGWLSEDLLSKKRVAMLLCQIFDLTDTKRKADSRTEESIYQLLKGKVDKDDQYKRVYFIDEPKYFRQFGGINDLKK